LGFTAYGCPVYSAGEQVLITETALIEAQPAVLQWMQQVALEGAAYKNEAIEILGDEIGGVTTEELDSPWGAPEVDAAEGNAVQKEDVKPKGAEATKGEMEDKSNDGKTTGAGKDGTGKDGPVMTGDSKPDCSSRADDGPEARDMVDLVEEIEDLTMHD
jgi:hypothetical protein